MAEKRRYTVSLPDHVADAVEVHAKPLGATPTEYAGDIVRWWFGQGCPPVTADEQALRKVADALKQRILPLPKNLNVWSLDPKHDYVITEDHIVQTLLDQLGLPNLFAQAQEHDELRMHIAFDNHPTHWLVFDIFKGSNKPDGDGIAFAAYPKATVSRDEMLRKVHAEMKKMGAKEKFEFSQIPILENKKSGNQTATKHSHVS